MEKKSLLLLGGAAVVAGVGIYMWQKGKEEKKDEKLTDVLKDGGMGDLKTDLDDVKNVVEQQKAMTASFDRLVDSTGDKRPSEDQIAFVRDFISKLPAEASAPGASAKTADMFTKISTILSSPKTANATPDEALMIFKTLGALGAAKQMGGGFADMIGTTPGGFKAGDSYLSWSPPGPVPEGPAGVVFKEMNKDAKSALWKVANEKTYMPVEGVEDTFTFTPLPAPSVSLSAAELIAGKNRDGAYVIVSAAGDNNYFSFVSEADAVAMASEDSAKWSVFLRPNEYAAV